MFEFFLALFGGLYYGTKLCNEKHQLKKADERNKETINSLNNDFDGWIRRVTNEKLEYEIQFTSDSAVNAIHNRIVNEAKITTVTPDMIIMGDCLHNMVRFQKQLQREEFILAGFGIMQKSYAGRNKENLCFGMTKNLGNMESRNLYCLSME